MKGETQLRAKRTRIKILRAIAEKNGTAGFSDIKTTTGLSTGSIYYHLERMSSYIVKDAKHYAITEEGLELLRESDPKYAKSLPLRNPEEGARQERIDEHETRAGAEQEAASSSGRTKQLAMAGAGGALVLAFVLSGWSGPVASAFGSSSSILFVSIAAAAIVAAFSLRGSRGLPPVLGYRLTVAALSVAVLLSGIIFISHAPFSGAAQVHYDNSMDALLSTYSLHWQVR